jgi:hypothetical protein
MQVTLGLRVLAVLATVLCFACNRAEKPAAPAPAAAPADNAAQDSEEAATAAESAAESAEAAASAAEAAEEVSGEAAGILATLGFVDDRGDTVQVLNTKIGTKVTFIPATIVVTAGVGKKLSIFNDTDAPHGFKIPGLAIETILPPGEETVVALPPLTSPQIYAINCHLHPPHRHATLIVLPSHASASDAADTGSDAAEPAPMAPAPPAEGDSAQ